MGMARASSGPPTAATARFPSVWKLTGGVGAALVLMAGSAMVLMAGSAMVLMAGSAMVLMAGSAMAQSPVYMDTGSHQVTVDLSVIDDGGYGASGPGVSPSYRGGRRLLMPGLRPPVSRFHAPPGSGLSDVPLSRPRKTASKTPSAPAKAPPAPAPKMTAAPPPPPAASEAPPPKSPPPKVAKSEAPPPPAAAKTAPAKAAATPPAAPPPPPAPAPAKSAAAPPPKAVEKASLPSTGGDAGARVVFAADASKIPDAAKASLRKIAGAIKGKDGLRLQLLAYAGGETLSASKARRLALSRALSVRSYLTEIGVRGNRIDVRALGNKVSDEPMNRVDVVVVER
jgi:outer membrane protein OmpA-like peptidoglycan-associated protein